MERIEIGDGQTVIGIGGIYIMDYPDEITDRELLNDEKEVLDSFAEFIRGLNANLHQEESIPDVILSVEEQLSIAESAIELLHVQLDDNAITIDSLNSIIKQLAEENVSLKTENSQVKGILNDVSNALVNDASDVRVEYNIIFTQNDQ